MKGYLYLETGHLYEGNWLITPPQTDVDGEVVYYTGMTGYEQVLYDPQYTGKIVVFTFPLIGNCGITEETFYNKKPSVAGVVVYEGNHEGSHYEGKYSLKEYLAKWNVPILEHIDTRSVMKKIRAKKSICAQLTHDRGAIEMNLMNGRRAIYA